MQFFFITCAIMAVSIFIIQRIAVFFGFGLKLRSLALCAAMAIGANLAALTISSYMTLDYVVLIFFGIVASAALVTYYNEYLIRKDSEAANATPLSTIEAQMASVAPEQTGAAAEMAAPPDEALAVAPDAPYVAPAAPPPLEIEMPADVYTYANEEYAAPPAASVGWESIARYSEDLPEELKQADNLLDEVIAAVGHSDSFRPSYGEPDVAPTPVSADEGEMAAQPGAAESETGEYFAPPVAETAGNEDTYKPDYSAVAENASAAPSFGETAEIAVEPLAVIEPLVPLTPAAAAEFPAPPKESGIASIAVEPLEVIAPAFNREIAADAVLADNPFGEIALAADEEVAPSGTAEAAALEMPSAAEEIPAAAPSEGQDEAAVSPVAPAESEPRPEVSTAAVPAAGTAESAEEPALAAEPGEEIEPVTAPEPPAAVEAEADALAEIAKLATLDDILDYAYSQRDKGNIISTIAAYNQALKRYEYDDYAPFVVIELADLYKQLGRYDEAINTFYWSLGLPAVLAHNLEQNFQSSMRYLAATERVLERSGQPNLPFGRLDAAQLREIEAELAD